MDLKNLGNSVQTIKYSAGRYGVAILATAIAIWGRRLLHPWLGDQCEFTLFYLSVLATAWISGTGPAIFAILLGTISAAHFFIEPASLFYIEDVPDLLQLCIYVFVNVVATLLFSRLERQRRLAENRSSENARLSDSLRLADERKDEFLALLAHELRNPLAPIQSSLAILNRKSESPDTVLRICNVIQRHTNHLVRITDDLLDVSRFCHGKVTLQMERMDLRDAVRDAVEMTAEMIETKSHTLQLLLPNTPVWVDGDRVRLTQLLANLLGNAAKYTPASGRIALHVEVMDGIVSTSVTDNGIGFCPTEAERMLAPFTQIDTSRTREYGGLGLGLSIVNRLVGLHGGTLETFSKGTGRGSRFTVNLPSPPRDAPNEAAIDQSLEPEPFGEFSAAETNSAGNGRNLLLVEDNLDAAALLSELLESEGYAVQVANNGLAALQAASTRQQDVIILDIGLPGMDGYEVAQRLRRNETTRNTRLIALTGWGTAADRELAHQAGFDFHVVKPVVFAELLRYVQGDISQLEGRARDAANV